MVFLSTLQALIGGPLIRSVFSFGTRQLTQRILVEELFMGLLLVFPLSVCIAFFTIRVACFGKRPTWVRSDIWTTIIVTLVGDIFLELLLPSLQCLPSQPLLHDPMSDESFAHSYFIWLAQSWGFWCPQELDRSELLSTDAVGTLLTVRLIFMCLGIYLGESWVPVALTGSIATGKSTVAKLLASENPKNAISTSSSSSSKGKGSKGVPQPPPSFGSPSQSKKARKSRRASSSTTQGDSSSATADADVSGAGMFAAANEMSPSMSLSNALFSGASSGLEEEGTFLIIDTDRIAHEILLPPWMLAGYSSPDLMEGVGGVIDEIYYHECDDIDANGGLAAATYMVQPHHSVYYKILEAFGQDEKEEDDGQNFDSKNNKGDDDDLNNDVKSKLKEEKEHSSGVNNDSSESTFLIRNKGPDSKENGGILDENGLVDRLKLGEQIFKHPHLRRKLNGITHPRILSVLLQHIFRGIFLSSKDVVCADIPLLFESGQLRWLFGITICVACDHDKQYQRLRQRNPELTEEQCWDRINSQMPLAQKVKKADIVIWNNGDLEQLTDQVEQVRRDVMGRIYGIGMSLLQMLLLVGGSLSLAVSSKLFSSWT